MEDRISGDQTDETGLLWPNERKAETEDTEQLA